MSHVLCQSLHIFLIWDNKNKFHPDPSLPIGRRKEIDNVMKKARANTNDYWDKKLLEVEEKDPNRWRHTGYKKMYIEGESSSESDRESFRYSRVHLLIHNFHLFCIFWISICNCQLHSMDSTEYETTSIKCLYILERI